MRRILLAALFAALPLGADAQERSCVALQELLFAFIDTARAVADHNERMGEAAIANALSSGETEFSTLVRERSQAVMSLLAEGANSATEIVQRSGCFVQ